MALGEHINSASALLTAPARGEDGRDRRSRFLRGELGDPADPLPGEQGGEHPGVKITIVCSPPLAPVEARP